MATLDSTGNEEADSTQENGFRRGYAHGAQAVIDALSGFMDEHRLMKLQKWASNELGAWRTGAAGGLEAPVPPNLNDSFPNQVKS